MNNSANEERQAAASKAVEAGGGSLLLDCVDGNGAVKAFYVLEELKYEWERGNAHITDGFINLFEPQHLEFGRYKEEDDAALRREGITFTHYILQYAYVFSSRVVYTWPSEAKLSRISFAFSNELPTCTTSRTTSPIPNDPSSFVPVA